MDQVARKSLLFFFVATVSSAPTIVAPGRQTRAPTFPVSENLHPIVLVMDTDEGEDHPSNVAFVQQEVGPLVGGYRVGELSRI